MAAVRVARIVLVPTVLGLLGACGTSSAGDGGGTRRQGVACVREVGADDNFCERYVADLARRAPLRPEQAATAETARRSVAQALSGDVLNRCSTGHEPCDKVMAWGDEPATAEYVRLRLDSVTTGVPQVRPARGDDPAPADAVIFGVLSGPICVYGYQRRNEGPDRVFAAGPLSGGTCLAP